MCSQINNHYSPFLGESSSKNRPNVPTVDKIMNTIDEQTTNRNNKNNINVQRECPIARSICSNEALMQQDNDEDQAKNLDENPGEHLNDQHVKSKKVG
uniref:Uncharacterized protein n=1 Tax=Romanomermis culicivorax TaxID=13658 RepID=A0A915III7_ROMCU